MDSTKKLFLNLIKIHQIDPNFFISETYLSQPDIVGKSESNWVWIEELGKPLFPALPIYICKESDVYEYPFVNEYWCGFDGTINDWINLPDKTFLDYQYIYDPKTFLNLSGGRWQSFRKNIRKFMKSHQGFAYSMSAHEENVRMLLGDWLKRHRETVQDADFIIECILKPKSTDYFRYLYNKQRELLAINYADENYKYINYRFVLTNGEPYVDEFARYCFYTDPFIQSQNKLVNDGGVLDSKGLEKFKDKLNPLRKVKMYSWNYKQ